MGAEDETLERGNWGGKLDFLLSAVGYAVGLGNVWRFPYLAYRNGGASFLFPYIIMLFIAGLPLFFIELAIGQFASEGPITVWKVAPLFTGELFKKDCVMNKTIAETYNDYDMNLGFSDQYNKWMDSFWNAYPSSTGQFSNLTWQQIQTFWGFQACEYEYNTPSQEFFEFYVLRQQNSEDIGDLGDISLKLILTLFLAWLLIFGCLMKGIKTSGKVVYFTATFPYVILIVLLIRGVTLEGYEDGIDFYVIPEWDKLTDAKIWGDAATQIFYSLGIGFGGLLTMSSYNKFHNNCPGLAFIAYPDGISRLPASSLWAFLFFFMILTLGMDSQGGIRVLTLMNDYSGSYNLMVVALFEIICLCYVYGLNNFRSDIEMMLGFKPMYYWIVTWMFLTPVAIIFIIVVSAIQYETSGYGDETFAPWAEGIGWLMVAVPILAILIVGVIQFCRYGYPACIQPTSTWGPSQPEDRTGRYAAINAAFEDDNGTALPYVVDSKNGPPPTLNNDNKGYEYDNSAAPYVTQRL
ncbi:sodium- and chloride-dependent glycine transporter 1 [Aplysia californica]|uniref:Transporter n=1 Tax=Aplysia californica TaxID=6500 RepID=A0ABM1ADL7_APLCA|nr:sodium- and chloride-dependent glycine transporter 1 [Aplysia californica]